jgi:hypothetical protein
MPVHFYLYFAGDLECWYWTPRVKPPYNSQCRNDIFDVSIIIPLLIDNSLGVHNVLKSAE